MCIVIKACFTINPCACLYKKKSCMTRVIGGRCHEYIFVATNTCLSRQNTSFVAGGVLSRQKNACRDKTFVLYLFVATKKKKKEKNETCGSSRQ